MKLNINGTDLNASWLRSLVGLTRVKTSKPRTIPNYGSFVHHEQQFCYELGFKHGVASLRKAQRERIREDFTV